MLKIVVMDGRMCSGLIDQDKVKEITMEFEGDYPVPDLESVEYERKLGCLLLDKYPEVITATPTDLEELTAENWHSTRRTIEFLKEEYNNFLKFDKIEEFKKFRKC